MDYRAVLLSVVAAGDVAAIEGLFAEEELLAQVDRTERYMRREVATDQRSPWYSVDVSHQCTTIFGYAVEAGQYDAVKWFYSRERLPILRATLAYACPAAVMVALANERVDMLELLLNAAVDLFPHADALQAKLDSLIRWSNTGDMARVLVAHGASINANDGLRHCAASGTSERVDVFKAEGARFIGDSVLDGCSYMSSREAVSRLLELGVDWGSGSQALIDAAVSANLAAVELYLQDTFVDVDVRNDHGQSALMQAVRFGRRGLGSSSEDVPAVVRALLGAGADFTLQDDQGYTALHHAIRSEYTEVVEILLQSGADAQAVMIDTGFMDDMVYLIDRDSEMFMKFELLLEYGADPNARSSEGVSFADQLMGRNAGIAFIDARNEYFVGK